MGALATIPSPFRWGIGLPAVLLSNPTAQQLRSVALHSGPLAAVAALPHLAALHLSAPRIDTVELSAALASALHLTSLHLVDGPHAPLVSVFSSCRSLLHLSFLSPHHSRSSRIRTSAPLCSRCGWTSWIARRRVGLPPAVETIVVETKGAELDRWGNWQDDPNPSMDTLRTLMQARPKLEVALLPFEVAAMDGPLFDLREKLRLCYQRLEDELRASGGAGFRFCSTTEKQAAKMMPQFALA